MADAQIESEGDCSIETASHQDMNSSTPLMQREISIHIPPDSLSRECCGKIPEILRMLNQEAYTPLLVSIGPIHYDHASCREIKKQKVKYNKYFFSRVRNMEALQHNFKDFIESNSEMIFNQYPHSSLWRTKLEICEIILEDAVFILEHFLRNSSPAASPKGDDYPLNTPSFSHNIQRDLLLAENQLPLFVLEELYQRFIGHDGTPKPKDQEHPTFRNLCLDYFSNLPICLGNQREQERAVRHNSIKHFTDLIRYLYLPAYFLYFPHESSSNNKRGQQIHSLKSATKLKKAGINFKQVNDRSLMDIRFKARSCQPCLDFPKIIIDDLAEVIFRNIIAFEQHHYNPTQHHFSAYVRLLRDLIDTPEDVALLVDKYVLVHTLDTNEEVVTLIKKLNKGWVINSSTYNEIIRAVREYCDSAWKHLKFTYFRDLWRTSSTIVGFAVFVFTTTNTVRAFVDGF
ncbi:UPF0481 protein At3g47200-like [Prosopis cineraria]|uniref:UPF0481 protein At3g47200-like n=1 Tax=Prosopis cineraria TaxID=364024 RepID=UPI00240FD706|nr:UPF0481 protein At3g47200-like [Prosopis cineraria]